MYRMMKVIHLRPSLVCQLTVIIRRLAFRFVTHLFYYAFEQSTIAMQCDFSSFHHYVEIFSYVNFYVMRLIYWHVNLTAPLILY